VTTKNLETVSGLVEQVNAKQTGIKVAGEWLNVSAYHALAELPSLASASTSGRSHRSRRVHQRHRGPGRWPDSPVGGMPRYG
jgi:hypothetical protein